MAFCQVLTEVFHSFRTNWTLLVQILFRSFAPLFRFQQFWARRSFRVIFCGDIFCGASGFGSVCGGGGLVIKTSLFSSKRSHSRMSSKPSISVSEVANCSIRAWVVGPGGGRLKLLSGSNWLGLSLLGKFCSELSFFTFVYNSTRSKSGGHWMSN